MTSRTTVRTVVTLVAALCVVTMFTGSAVALVNFGSDAADDDDDGLVNIDTGLDTEAGESGGGGFGGLSVDTDQGGASGVGAVEANAATQELNVTLEGQGGPGAEEERTKVGVDCTLSPDSATAPQDACEPIGDIPPETSGSSLTSLFSL